MMLWIRCPVCVRRVSTGIEMHAATLAQLPDRIEDFKCNACGQRHAWLKREAWLVDGYVAANPTVRPAIGAPPQPRSILEIAHRKPPIATGAYTVH